MSREPLDRGGKVAAVFSIFSRATREGRLHPACLASFGLDTALKIEIDNDGEIRLEMVLYTEIELYVLLCSLSQMMPK